MTPAPKYRRRILVVDRRFQLGLLIRAAILSLLTQAAVLIGLVVPLVLGLGSIESDQLSKLDASIVLLHLHRNLWWILLICIALPVLGSLRMSHRIAGPMLRVKRHLRMIGQGRLPGPLHTRHGDYMQDEVDSLNATLVRLDRHFSALHRIAAELQAAIANTISAEDADPRSSRVTILRGIADALQERLHDLQPVGDGPPAPPPQPVLQAEPQTTPQSSSAR
jgi:hypothetical protein